MKTYLYLLVILSVVFGCSVSFNYKTDKTLKERYTYTQKASDLNFYYNIKHTDREKIIDLNIKNISNMFIIGLSFDITDEMGKFQKYVYVGNLKNLNSKNIEIVVDKNINRLKLSYRYELTPEDAFLNPDVTKDRIYEKSETTILIIK
ncbi:MAG: hypothetical protein N3C60_06710 [Calditerrivibrio sp.]|nr:hypothetical protein [Calditerrivibrio sp.]